MFVLVFDFGLSLSLIGKTLNYHFDTDSYAIHKYLAILGQDYITIKPRMKLRVRINMVESLLLHLHDTYKTNLFKQEKGSC